ncbi:MAG: hypothetical protein QOI01_1359 [Mycobacterium sp.]|jgi:hypothetical protein|nr:hypothetical protein [Mycobacterium sp.]MDT5199747.1 hypothetical protein [Mycobacterium sp.]
MIASNPGLLERDLIEQQRMADGSAAHFISAESTQTSQDSRLAWGSMCSVRLTGSG